MTEFTYFLCEIGSEKSTSPNHIFFVVFAITQLRR